MENKRIVLGVCGGIAAYKACDLASRLTQMRAHVDVVMTQSAQKFVAPLTFQALTQRAVHTSLWPETSDENGVAAAMAHIELASCDAILIAPASADTIAKLAHGLADDLLTTLVVASRAPVLVAPAMNPQMLAHAATQRNLAHLRELGYRISEPEFGRMACEHVGAGRLPTTDVLVEALEDVLFPTRDLENVRVVVTAGPTREPIDPVRYISNRSSGKMGFAIAENCARRGALVTLISGPVNLPTPAGCTRVDVTTTEEMFQTATKDAQTADVVVAAAAPADYSVEAAPQKLKKSTVDFDRTLQLRETPDILGTIGKTKRPDQILVGFAAETENLLANAREKLTRKNCDAIVANDVMQEGAGFDSETNIVTWVSQDAEETWPLASKAEVAARIVDKIAQMRA
ncbi:MAG TPA: bifunctional phosphopantothenoylcysteine decarboxylase/phosphopantothenate--cysteine ligase CoaBC [Abditibacteriaceae bacterium]|jgi:phosphopantothenoylcysteine decarboxylase/phosphopantothenate--cysteine ligase